MKKVKPTCQICNKPISETSKLVCCSAECLDKYMERSKEKIATGRFQCKTCDDIMVIDYSKVLTSIPPQHMATCQKCGKIEFVPTIVVDHRWEIPENKEIRIITRITRLRWKQVNNWDECNAFGGIDGYRYVLEAETTTELGDGREQIDWSEVETD